MELDFTKLNSLAFMDFSEIPPEKQPSKMPTETLLEPEGYKTPLEEENALQGLTEDRESNTGTRTKNNAIKRNDSKGTGRGELNSLTPLPFCK